MTPRPAHTRRPADFRRGTMYVAVLGVALLITVIGLAALMAARVGQHDVVLTQAAIQTDFTAQSVIDLARFRLTQYPGWRTKYTNDVWTAGGTLGDVSYSFKLVDEQDGDLSDDSSEPVRLYARASAGTVARLYSVMLEGDRGGGSNNLFDNPGMESGTTGWWGFYADIASCSDEYHDGAASLDTTNRSEWYCGPAQTIDDRLENNTPYDVEVWVRMHSGSALVKLVIWVLYEQYYQEWFIEGDTWVDDGEWTKVSATITPKWSGKLDDALFKVITASDTDDFYIDDAVMAASGEADKGSAPLPIPGTCRREVLP